MRRAGAGRGGWADDAERTHPPRRESATRRARGCTVEAPAGVIGSRCGTPAPELAAHLRAVARWLARDARGAAGLLPPRVARAATPGGGPGHAAATAPSCARSGRVDEALILCRGSGCHRPRGPWWRRPQRISARLILANEAARWAAASPPVARRAARPHRRGAESIATSSPRSAREHQLRAALHGRPREWWADDRRVLVGCAGAAAPARRAALRERSPRPRNLPIGRGRLARRRPGALHSPAGQAGWPRRRPRDQGAAVGVEDPDHAAGGGDDRFGRDKHRQARRLSGRAQAVGSGCAQRAGRLPPRARWRPTTTCARLRRAGRAMAAAAAPVIVRETRRRDASCAPGRDEAELGASGWSFLGGGAGSDRCAGAAAPGHAEEWQDGRRRGSAMRS